MRSSSHSRRPFRVWAAVGLWGLVAIPMALLLPAPPKVGSINGIDRLDALDRAWPGFIEPVTIHWDEHLIPSIIASSDDDAAYAIGLVHAHLRLTQMEIFRKLSQGRLSEMAGPLTVEIDHALRALDMGRAAPEMAAQLPPETRRWMDRYVRGLNDYRVTIAAIPADARTVGIDFSEPWTIEDVLTIGRLASVDVNWGRWLGMIPLRGQQGAEEFSRRVWSFADEGLPSYGAETRTDLSALLDASRSGSNAFVVHGDRSASGGALVACDPHLGLTQPNFWVVIGVRTPETAQVGLSMPGLPFVLVGRSERIAWVGTNMQGASSALYRLPTGWEPRRERVENIGVRGWFDRTRTIRESAHGPVLTDAPVMRRLGSGDIAIRWRGHEPSDEASAFMRAARAADFDSFRNAFATYATGGQNMLFGDSSGNIGQVMAIEAIPAAGRAARLGPVPAGDPAFAWGPGVPSHELPAAFNPPSGFLVSANNIPTPTEPHLVPMGNANDRLVRMTELLATGGSLSLDDLAQIQLDTHSRASLTTARAIAAAADPDALSERARSLVESLGAWDGDYATDSPGAVAYQASLDALIDALYEDRYAPAIRSMIRMAPYGHRFVLEDLERLDDPALLANALELASEKWTPGTTWGEMHRLRVAHPLGALPVIGGRFAFGDIPAAGSTTTIVKSAHRVQPDRHFATFGAQSRILFDLGTIDDNRVVLLGGQDGWPGSDRMIDQVELWEQGRTAPLPLSQEAQRERAVRTMTLAPTGATNGAGP